MRSHLAADVAATRDCGARLARALLSAASPQSPVVVTLEGELGAGKTTFVGGLLAELGHRGPVRSPTYTLIEPYHFHARDIQHCDFYRLRTPDELDDLGWRDLLVPGAVLLVEWPDRAGDRLGGADLAVRLDYAGADARNISFTAYSEMGRALIDAL
jgi:tRNA threonylcarbamoyladenosine biosynthesis protein TsaE